MKLRLFYQDFLLKITRNISPNKLRVIVYIFTLITMLATLVIGHEAYSTSRDSVLKNVYESNLDLARAFRDYSATKSPQTKERDVLNSLRTAWNSMDRSVKGGFLCVVDNKGKLTLHTAAPNREGADVGKNAIHPTNRQTLRELVNDKKDFVGPYLSSAGQDQIAAFAYVPKLKSVISIHVPFDKIEEQINKTTLPWIIGLMLISGLLLPLSNWALHRVYLTSQENVKNTHRLLEEKNIERLQAEQKLYDKDKENSLIINGMVEAVITITEDGIVKSFNTAAEKMFGYSEKEVIGLNISMLIPAPDREQHDSFLAKYLTTGNSRIIGIGRNVIAQRKNGETLPIHLSVSELPADENGKRRFIGSCLDITQQIMQEEHLRRSQKMEALGKLTGGIAHDYNNMLGVILGFSELLEMSEKNDEKTKEHINEIIRATERGISLTRKFVAFSKSEFDSPEVTNLNNVLLDDKNMIEKTLTVRIELIYELDAEMWNIYVDKNELEDSILNMAINAMHAMPDGGRLLIKSKNMHIEKLEADTLNISEGEYVELSISDTGTGISEDVKNHIFDPFYTTKENKGSGLGLSQVYSFVKKSNGVIKLYSELGKGTRFSLFFPRYKGDYDYNAESIAEEKDLSGNENILVVDDEKALIRVAKNILEGKGYKIFTAENGMQALTILENEKIDLVLSDIVMHEMDGYELVNIIQETYPWIKIQLTSGFSDIPSKHEMINKVDNKLLQKPYDSVSLLCSVRAALEN